MSRPRVKDRHRRDFAAYVRFHQPGGLFDVDQPGACAGYSSDTSAIQAFIIRESTGKLDPIPCDDPDLFRRAVVGKSQLVFQIEQWADGINDGLFDIAEFKEEYSWLPDWVWVSLLNQTNGRGNKMHWKHDDLAREAANCTSGGDDA